MSQGAAKIWKKKKITRTIQDRCILILSARDTEAVVNAILNPPKPGPALRAAARAYKNRIGRCARAARARSVTNPAQ